MSTLPNEFDWRRFLNVAQECLGHTDEEWLRTGVGRAYYACFLCARDYQQSQNQSPDLQTAHQKVWNYYRDHGGRVHKQIFQMASRLKRKRTLADYEQCTLAWLEELKTSISLSEKIIKLLDGL